MEFMNLIKLTDMDSVIISQVSLAIAILTTGVVYGTDVFYALVVKKAAALSKDSSIADLIGHTHLVADKRMPPIAITSILCTIICVVLNFRNAYTAGLSGAALFMLLAHLYLYITIAKPINIAMTDAAVKNIIRDDIRALQIRWDSIINYRAAFLTAAMLLLIIAIIVCDK
jgi:hypothetical protein